MSNNKGNGIRYMGTIKIDECESLQRKSFKQDSAFYEQGLSISSFEQAQYQGLRNWEMDCFYIYVPGTRNSLYFREHPENQEV